MSERFAQARQGLADQRSYRAALFDLDGVIVDTAKYHYLAWKQLANQFGIDFTPHDNEAFKGVSRDRCLTLLLDKAGLPERLSPDEKEKLASRKNQWYIDLLRDMNTSELLPGAEACVFELRKIGIKTALCSASKNSPLILARLGIASWFDTVVDGNRVTRAKPDPEVFLAAAEDLRITPEECVVFEDAQAGIHAAKVARMYAVGVGDRAILGESDLVIENLGQFRLSDLFGDGQAQVTTTVKETEA